MWICCWFRFMVLDFGQWWVSQGQTKPVSTENPLVHLDWFGRCHLANCFLAYIILPIHISYIQNMHTYKYQAPPPHGNMVLPKSINIFTVLKPSMIGTSYFQANFISVNSFRLALHSKETKTPVCPPGQWFGFGGRIFRTPREIVAGWKLEVFLFPSKLHYFCWPQRMTLIWPPRLCIGFIGLHSNKLTIGPFFLGIGESFPYNDDFVIQIEASA